MKLNVLINLVLTKKKCSWFSNPKIGLSVLQSVSPSVHQSVSKFIHRPVTFLLGNSTSRFVSPSVHLSITLYFLWGFVVFGLTAPSQMIIFTYFYVYPIQLLVRNCSRYHTFSSGGHVPAVDLKNRN